MKNIARRFTPNLQKAGLMLAITFLLSSIHLFADVSLDVSGNTSWAQMIDGTNSDGTYNPASDGNLTINHTAGAGIYTITLGTDVDMQGNDLILQTDTGGMLLTIDLNGYTISNVGDLQMNNTNAIGTIQFNGGTIECATFSGFDDGTNDVLTLDNTATLTCTGALTALGAGGVLTLGDGAQVTAGGAITFDAFTVSNDASVSITAADNTDVTFGGAITGGGAGETISITQGDIVVSGDYLDQIENLTLSGTDAQDITLTSATVPSIITNATANIGDLTIDGSAAAASLRLPTSLTLNIGGDLLIDANASNADFVLADGVTVNVTGSTTLDYSGGALTLDAVNNTDVAALNFNGSLTATTGGTIAFSNLAASTIAINHSLAADWELPDAVTLGGLTIDMSNDVSNSVTFDAGANTFTVDDLTITNGTLAPNSAQTGDLVITVNTSLTIANDTDADLDIRGTNGRTCELELGNNTGTCTVSIGASGTLATDANSLITTNDDLVGWTMPATVSTLSELKVYSSNGVTLGGDLSVAVLQLTDGANDGQLNVGSGNTLTLTLGAALAFAAPAAACVLNIDDASLIIDEDGNALTNLTNMGFQTNSGSDFSLTVDNATAYTLDATFDDCDDLTFTVNAAAELELSAALRVHGDLTLDGSAAAATLDMKGQNLRIDGTFDTSANTAGITLNTDVAGSVASGTLTFNGPVNFNQFTFTDGGTTSADLVIGGAGSITGTWPGLAGTDVDLTSLYYDRPGVTLTLAGQTGASTNTIGTLTVNRGTVAYAENENAGDVLNLTGDVTVETAGTLILGTTVTGGTADVATTLCTDPNSVLQVAGTLLLYGASDQPLAFTLGATGAGSENGQLQVTGTFAANQYVNVNLYTYINGSSKTEQLNLPATFTQCNNLAIQSNAAGGGAMEYQVTLQNDLDIAGTLTLTGTAGGEAHATLRTSSNTLTVTGATSIAAGGVLDASTGSVIFENTVTLANNAEAALIFNSATNAEFQNDFSDLGAGDADIYEVNNLILNAPDDNNADNQFTLASNLICRGNLEIYLNSTDATADGDALVTGGYDITVYGDLVVDNNYASANFADECINFGSGTDLYLYGNMSDGGASKRDNLYELTNKPYLHILEQSEGSALQFTMPTGLNSIKSLELVRTNGLALQGEDLTIGTSGGDVVTLTRGDFDLNGQTSVTLGDPDVVITETDGMFVNNGVEGGYVSTAAACTDLQIIASGIGIDDIDDGTNNNYQVYRFPKSTIIEGDDFNTRVSVGRFYGITSAANIVDVTFRIGDDEMGNNSFAGLDVYYKAKDPSSYDNFTSNVTLYDDDSPHADVNIVHTPTVNGYGTLRIENPSTTGAPFANAGAMFGFASQDSTSGMIYTFTGTSGSLWNTPANWSGGVVPGKNDDVVISTDVLVSANAQPFEAASIILTGSGSIKPTPGDEVSIRVMGDVELTGANTSIDCINGTGRIAFIFGEEGGDPVSLDIKPANNYSSTKGIRFHDVSLINANISQSGDYNMVAAGDIDLSGVSVLDCSAGTLTFDGSVEDTVSLTVDGISSVAFKNLYLDNNADVTTNADISLSNTLALTQASCSFVQSHDTKDVFFDITGAGADIEGWNVFEGAYCRLDNLNLTVTDNNIEPYGDIYIYGDFTFSTSGNGEFNHNSTNANPDGNAVIFGNVSGTSNIARSSDDEDQLIFDEIRVLEDCNVNTVSDFYLRREINVQEDGSFIANAGTVYLEDGLNVAKTYIYNESDQTLEFFNLDLNCSNTVYTTSDFTVKGNLNNQDNSVLNCYDGTISFDNTTTKTISNGTSAELNFHKIAVPDGSHVTTDASFSITNNGDDDDYKDDSGIEVTGTGIFRQTAGVCLFENLDAAVQSNPGAGNPKVIYVEHGDSTDSGGNYVGGQLDLYRIQIANEPNNDVTTESNFRLGGGGTTVGNARTSPAFENLSAAIGGTFTASNGSTVTFDGDHPDTGSGSQTYSWAAIGNSTVKGSVIFENIVASGISLELIQDNYLTVNGDISVNSDATESDPQFSQAVPGTPDACLRFAGQYQQKLSGTSTHDNPFLFSDVEIIKTNTDSLDYQEVLMETDVQFIDDANLSIYLTEGYLNLGSDTLEIYEPGTFIQSVPSANSGAAINGGTGTLYLQEEMANTTYRFLRDRTFTVEDEATLYNLFVGDDEELENDLTINNDLTLENYLEIKGETMSVYGDIALNGEPTSGTDYLTGDNTGTLKLLGTGSVSEFSDTEYVSGTGYWPFNIYIGRAEILAGDVTIGASGATTEPNFILDCAVNTINLADNTLDLQYTTEIERLSGSITSSTGSKVIWSETDNTMPANFFADGEVATLDLDPLTTSTFTIEGDLTINTELIGVLDIFTVDNILEFAEGCAVPNFTESEHIVGNLRRTAASAKPTVFPLGDGTSTSYRPLTLTGKSVTTTRTFLVSASNQDPTAGLGGNPHDAVDIVWNITAEGSSSDDYVKIQWSWERSFETGGFYATSGRAFAASWDSTLRKWNNYHADMEPFILTGATDTRNLSTDDAVIPISEIGGLWTVFITETPDASISDVDSGLPQADSSQRSDAVSVSKNIVKISNISNLPAGGSLNSEVTVQLQDRYGQPITLDEPFEYTVTEIIGNGGFADYTNVIPAGETSGKFQLNYTSPCNRVQLVADTSGGSDRWSPSASEVFAVLADAPGVQASGIVVSNITASSAEIQFNNNSNINTILFVNADELLDEEDYPEDGESYTANSLIGAGSALGSASVIYNTYNTSGTVSNVKVYGLAPQTTYYIYALNYEDASSGATVAKGSEAYSTKSAIGNPKEFTTSGSYDDDLAYGSNDTKETAKPIGTNSPVRGTINDTDDEDWYCFTVTGAAPNVRARLTGLPADYNFELYDTDNLRLRRSIRKNTASETFLINYLQPGTYLIRIYGENGAYDATQTYELMIETKGKKVYSVSR